MSDELHNIRINGVDVDTVEVYTERSIWGDRTLWGEGPWLEEPDLVRWTDPASGLACCVARNDELGHLCGYCRVPPGHPYWGLDTGALDSLIYVEATDEMLVSVHGGITYAKRGSGDAEHEGQSLQSGQPIEDEDGWWIGFDAAHAGDLSPGMVAILADSYRKFGEGGSGLLRSNIERIRMGQVYRDLGYVMDQTIHLAHQLVARSVEPSAPAHADYHDQST